MRQAKALGGELMRFSVTLLASLALAPPTLAELEDEVRCREISFSRSVENRDRELFASFIDPDARFISGSVARGPEAVAAAWAVFFDVDGPSIKWRPKYIEVLENGKLALSRGPYQLVTHDDDGKVIEHWGTFNSVWRLNPDGRWHVVFDAGGPLPDPPPADDRALLDQPDNCDTGS
jgi:ketosteroid isomerase-like protein